MPRRFLRCAKLGLPSSAATVSVARGEDDAGVVGEEGFGEQRGDVDGCGLQVGAEGLGCGDLRVARSAGGVA